jgi:hypothetical protein
MVASWHICAGELLLASSILLIGKISLVRSEHKEAALVVNIPARVA